MGLKIDFEELRSRIERERDEGAQKLYEAKKLLSCWQFPFNGDKLCVVDYLEDSEDGTRTWEVFFQKSTFTLEEFEQVCNWYQELKGKL